MDHARAPLGRPPRLALKSPLLRHFDALFVWAAVSAALFPLLLGPLTPLAFLVLPVIYSLVRKDRVVPILSRGWPILLLPGYALLSVFWSVDRGATVYYGVEYLLTVLVALQIGAGTERKSALFGAFAAFFIYGISTFASGIQTGTLHLGSSGAMPFVGISGSKNMSADVAGLGTLIALTTLLVAIHYRRGGLIMMSALLLFIDTLILLNAHSTGALVAVSFSVLALLAWTVSRALQVAGRIVILIATAVSGLAAALTKQLWLEPLFSHLLQVSGKGEDITGRSYIWSRADVLVEQRPLLGLGFNAFWTPGNLEAEAIWRRLGIFNKSGFNFHNSQYEIVVHLGYVGLVLFLLVYGLFAVSLLLKTMRHPNQTGMLMGAILFYNAMRAGFESIPLVVFSYAVLILYAALAWGCRANELDMKGLDEPASPVKAGRRFSRPRPLRRRPRTAS